MGVKTPTNYCSCVGGNLVISIDARVFVFSLQITLQNKLQQIVSLLPQLVILSVVILLLVVVVRWWGRWSWWPFLCGRGVLIGCDDDTGLYDR